MSWLERYFINEAKCAIERHAGGGEAPVLEEVTITENGEHIPPEGVDGFSKISINVTSESDTFGVYLKYKDGERLFSGYKTLTDDDLSKLSEALSAFEFTKASQMFSGATLITTVPYINISKANSTTQMFRDCKALTSIPQMDTSNVTTMEQIFYCCEALTSIPQMDTSNVTNMSYMFYQCTSLETIPEMNTGNVTTMYNMFRCCYALTSIPQIDTSKVTNMEAMFEICKALTSIPQMDTSNVTNMRRTFSNCESLVEIPLMNTSGVTDMYAMFSGCKSLTTVPELDMRNVTTAGSMFNICRNLTTCLLRNIKISLQVGSGTSEGHLLTHESLVHLIYELRDTGSLKTLTIGTANLSKLTDTYVLPIEITDDMRAEDDLIDEKLPFEVVDESTEGRIPITDYVSMKNWKLA